MSYADTDPTALSGKPDDKYQQEATLFVALMSDMASDLVLDYSVESIQRLEQFIVDNFDSAGISNVGESLTNGIGCYIGEVIIRHLGGYWSHEDKPEINNIGGVEVIFPIDKAVKRFQNGPSDSLNWYYHTIARHAYEGKHQATPEPIHTRKAESEVGLIGLLKGLFGK